MAMLASPERASTRLLDMAAQINGYILKPITSPDNLANTANFAFLYKTVLLAAQRSEARHLLS